ncbi:SDR family oxidoreductase [Fodinicola feengrottensis]|uniref:SDR family oxidoreductase n=1 Tax=Fodinicola feengrottensis TaxID=435914 RepID=A0ABN2H138_9ACTN
MTLSNAVVLVAGGTRGGSRAIAVQFGAAGATVYVTGRSSRAGRSPMNRPETVEETAEMVDAAGGRGIAVAVDHQDEKQVQELVERIDREQNGRLDILVNGIWGGDPLAHWDVPFWEQPIGDAIQLLRQGVETHLITSRFAVPLMVARKSGLIIELTDGTADSYRGSLYYDLVKSSVNRLALAQAADLRSYGITAVALSPGFLRSEAMLDHFGVSEENWRDGTQKDPHFIISETPTYLGRAAVALASDPDLRRWSGKAVGTQELSSVYGFTDIDGTRPDTERYFAEVVYGNKPPSENYRS